MERDRNVEYKVVGPNISFWTAFGITFVVLKLCHVIDWSWWFVLMPFYTPAILFFIVCIIFLVAYNRIYKKKNHNKRNKYHNKRNHK